MNSTELYTYNKVTLQKSTDHIETKQRTHETDVVPGHRVAATECQLNAVSHIWISQSAHSLCAPVGDSGA